MSNCLLDDTILRQFWQHRLSAILCKILPQNEVFCYFFLFCFWVCLSVFAFFSLFISRHTHTHTHPSTFAVRSLIFAFDTSAFWLSLYCIWLAMYRTLFKSMNDIFVVVVVVDWFLNSIVVGSIVHVFCILLRFM